MSGPVRSLIVCPLHGEFRSAQGHVADRLVIALDCLLSLGLLIVPRAHETCVPEAR
jgi:hypothetical protein